MESTLHQAELVLSLKLIKDCIGTNDYMVPFTSNSTVLQSYSKKEFRRGENGMLWQWSIESFHYLRPESIPTVR
ncbi:hypothetical protein D5086_031103 [Populus alba]|uniref:Uncharacterized protein n=1 Tax=Populus alba TaxID=43335 RepID=A0ACC4AQC6_POPAL